jgi:exopolysaccharide production protein ExoZ
VLSSLTTAAVDSNTLSASGILGVKPLPCSRLRQLDGLRGVAMLFVFFGHFSSMWESMPHPHGFAQQYLRVLDADATLGSSFFMLLSGSFAYSAMKHGKSFGPFIRARLCRLYPLYLVVATAYIAGSLLIPSMSKLPARPGPVAVFLLETLLLLPGVIPVKPIMDVGWTLSFIVLFYFISAAFARIFVVWPLKRPWRFAIFTGIGILWALLCYLTDLWPARTAIFWVGLALTEVVQGIMGRRVLCAMRLTVPAVALSIIGVLLRTWISLGTQLHGLYTLLPLAVTSVTLFAFVWLAYYGPAWWQRLLSQPGLCTLGAVSYSYYLSHGLAIKTFRFGIVPLLGSFAASPAVFWSSQIAVLLLSILIARLVYAFIDKPLSAIAARILANPRGIRGAIKSWRQGYSVPATVPKLQARSASAS